jgi:hypothetical protein
LAAAWHSIYHGKGDIASLWPLQQDDGHVENQIHPGSLINGPFDRENGKPIRSIILNKRNEK